MRPRSSTERLGSGRFPRVSGDAPLIFLPSFAFASFSPRERGCAPFDDDGGGRLDVFPA